MCSAFKHWLYSERLVAGSHLHVGSMKNRWQLWKNTVSRCRSKAHASVLGEHTSTDCLCHYIHDLPILCYQWPSTSRPPPRRWTWTRVGLCPTPWVATFWSLTSWETWPLSSIPMHWPKGPGWRKKSSTWWWGSVPNHTFPKLHCAGLQTQWSVAFCTAVQIICQYLASDLFFEQRKQIIVPNTELHLRVYTVA